MNYYSHDDDYYYDYENDAYYYHNLYDRNRYKWLFAGYQPDPKKWAIVFLLLAIAVVKPFVVLSIRAASTPDASRVEPRVESEEVKARFAEWDKQWAAYESAKQSNPELSFEDFLRGQQNDVK